MIDHDELVGILLNWFIDTLCFVFVLVYMYMYKLFELEKWKSEFKDVCLSCFDILVRFSESSGFYPFDCLKNICSLTPIFRSFVYPSNILYISNQMYAFKNHRRLKLKFVQQYCLPTFSRTCFINGEMKSPFWRSKVTTSIALLIEEKKRNQINCSLDYPTLLLEKLTFQWRYKLSLSKCHSKISFYFFSSCTFSIAYITPIVSRVINRFENKRSNTGMPTCRRAWGKAVMLLWGNLNLLYLFFWKYIFC